MNRRRAGKFVITAIVGLLSAITGIASMEMINSLKKETESGCTYGEKEQKEKDENK